MEFTEEKLQEVIEFCVEMHKGQRRKGNGLPYIFHPFRVAAKLIAVKESNHLFLLVAACLLHDTWEDCKEKGVTLEVIIDKFGVQVAALVQELTNDPVRMDDLGKLSYLKDKLAKMSSWALTIKLCDRWDNVEDMRSMDNAFKYKYRVQTEELLNYLSTVRGLTATQIDIVSRIKRELESYPADRQNGMLFTKEVS